MTNESMQLMLQLDSATDTDAEEIDALTRQLRAQLLELDVQSVDLVRSGDAPPGTRALEVMVLGNLLVALTKAPELLKSVTGLVQSWVARHPDHTIELNIGGDTLKVSAASADQQRDLIELFIQKHTLRVDAHASQP